MSPGKFAFAGVIVLLAVGMWLLSGSDEEQAAASAEKPLDPKVFKDLRTDAEKRADATRVQAGSQISRILLGESVKDRAKAIAILRNLGPVASGIDYHLRPGSPCIDAGDATVPNLPAVDVDGDPRHLAAGVDMGADEFFGTGVCGTGAVPGLGGGLFDVLAVNGSTGGTSRRVDLALFQPFNIEVSQPPSNPLPARFIVWVATVTIPSAPRTATSRTTSATITSTRVNPRLIFDGPARSRTR